MKNQKNKFHIYLLILIIITGTFLRVLSFKSNLTPDLTLDDSSRDILTAMHIARFNETPAGPPYCGGCPKHFQNSINYYYFLSFFYRLTSSSIGIYLLFLISGVSLIPLTYFIAKNLFNIPTGLIAASLIAVSQKLIYYSNFPLQPFLVPTISALIIFLVILDYRQKSIPYISFAGAILFLALQIHLSIFILLPFYFYNLINKRKIKDSLLVLLLISPFIISFLKNNFSLEPYSSFSNNHNFNFNLFEIIFQAYKNLFVSFAWLIDYKYSLFIPIIIAVTAIKFRKQIKPIFFLLLSAIMIGFFKNSATNYYDSPIIPIIIILFSATLYFICQIKEMLFGFFFFSIFYIDINAQINNFNHRGKNQIIVPTIEQIIDKNQDNLKPIYVWEYSDSQDNNIFFQYYFQKEEKSKKHLISTNDFIDIRKYADDSSKNKFIVCSSEKFSYQKNNENCQKFIKNTLKKNFRFLYGEPDKHPNYFLYQFF